MQIEKKKLFLFQLQICGSSSARRKKTRCRRMAPVPPFWNICQWQNFPGNLNTWLNTFSKRFFLLPFLQPKKNVQKSMLLHWFCPLNWWLMKPTRKMKLDLTHRTFILKNIQYRGVWRIVEESQVYYTTSHDELLSPRGILAIQKLAGINLRVWGRLYFRCRIITRWCRGNPGKSHSSRKNLERVKRGLAMSFITCKIIRILCV